MRGRSGGWNDDSRNSGTMLYPICQSQIPQSDINGRHMWGNGMSSSFNVRVCVEADDYLFFQDDRMWIRESPCPQRYRWPVEECNPDARRSWLTLVSNGRLGL